MGYCEEFEASLFVMFNVLGPDDLLHKTSLLEIHEISSDWMHHHGHDHCI
jgi:hypothetical protein